MTGGNGNSRNVWQLAFWVVTALFAVTTMLGGVVIGFMQRNVSDLKADVVINTAGRIENTIAIRVFQTQIQTMIENQAEFKMMLKDTLVEAKKP